MLYTIFNGGDENGNGTEEGTQAEAYDIDGQPLFDVPSANCMAFYADSQGEDESEEDTKADSDGDVPEATATGTAIAAKKKISTKMPFPAPSKRARPYGRGLMVRC
jgi:hypothetical protein